MSNTALPREAELRTWASRGIEVEGDVLVTRMPRLQAVIASGEEPAFATLRCWKDEQHRYIVDVKVQVTVALECQRCLSQCELSWQRRVASVSFGTRIRLKSCHRVMTR